MHALLLNVPLWVRKGMGVYYQHSPSLLSTAQFRCFDPEVVAAYHRTQCRAGEDLVLADVYDLCDDADNL